MEAAPLTPDQTRTASIEPSAGQHGVAGHREVLDLYLADTRQLFNSMDPAPFRQRDLDPNAETYILDWAQEAPVNRSLSLVLHLGDGCTTEDDAAIVRESVCEHFRRRALASRRHLQRLFQVGRYSLLIALVFLALVIVIGESLASSVSSERYASLIEDSLVIGSWVALWRPLEIFLYDWWPIRAEAKLFDRLSQMNVSTVSATTADCAGVAGPRS